MEEREILVHQGHCCLAHGCKYGDKDCPVVLGKVVQSYPCEVCGDIKVEDIPKLEEFTDLVYNKERSNDEEVTVTLGLIRSLILFD